MSTPTGSWACACCRRGRRQLPCWRWFLWIHLCSRRQADPNRDRFALPIPGEGKGLQGIRRQCRLSEEKPRLSGQILPLLLRILHVPGTVPRRHQRTRINRPRRTLSECQHTSAHKRHQRTSQNHARTNSEMTHHNTPCRHTCVDYARRKATTPNRNVTSGDKSPK